MRKSVFLLVVFVFLNMIFTGIVFSEGTISTEVSKDNAATISQGNGRNSESWKIDQKSDVKNVNESISEKAAEPVSQATVQATSETVQSKTEVQPAAVEVNNVISNTSTAVNSTAVITPVSSSAAVPASAPAITSTSAKTSANASVTAAVKAETNIYTATVKLSYKSDKKIKVLVEKDGIRYQYNLRNDGVSEYFPLQLGNGDYNVSVLENIEGTRYVYVSTQVVSLKLNDSKMAFLNSNQQISWNYESEAAKIAADLVYGLDNAEDKIKAIYDYVSGNIAYDFDKYNNLSTTYLPDLNSIISNQKGICFDYASLLAAMLRSVNIEAKLIKGYSNNVTGYHAWNEVYNKGTGTWNVIDATFDATYRQAGYEVNMIKDSSIYYKKLEF